MTKREERKRGQVRREKRDNRERVRGGGGEGKKKVRTEK